MSVPPEVTSSHSAHHPHWHGSSKGIMSVAVVTLSAFCLGYDAGMMSGAIDPIRTEFALTSFEEGMVVGSCNLMAGVGAITGSYVADKLGRVNGFAVTVVVLFVGPLLFIASQGYWVLVLSRSIIGIGIGWAFIVSPLYGAELSPPAVRGAVVSITEILIQLGIVLGLVAALLLEIPHLNPEAGWRLVCGLAAVPALLGLMCWPCLPESPRWLAQVGRRSDAEASLKALGAVSNDEELQEEMAEIDAAITAETDGGSWWAVFCPSPMMRRMLVAGCGCAFYAQACGSEALVYYSPMILKHVGLDDPKVANIGAMAVGLSKLAGSLVGARLLDWIGRRPAVVMSATGLFLSMVMLVFAVQLRLAPIGLLLLCTYIFSFEIGIGPGGFVLGSECYPTNLRAKGLSVGMCLSRFISGAVALCFPKMVEMFTMRGSLLIFATLTSTAVLWATLCVPETKGLPLEEVTELFNEPVCCRSLRARRADEPEEE